MSNMLFIGLFMLFTFGISWWNAYATGRIWVESKVAGQRFMAWMGAIMSACGFTWVYLIIEGYIVTNLQLIDVYWLGVMLKAGYVLIVPFVLFAGYAITFDSWRRAFHNGGVLNYGAAAYNTWASYHNTYNAINSFGRAFGDVVDAFTGKGKSRDSKDQGNLFVALFVAILVAAAAILGILTTTIIIKKTAAHDELPSLEELKRRRRLQEQKA